MTDSKSDQEVCNATVRHSGRRVFVESISNDATYRVCLCRGEWGVAVLPLSDVMLDNDAPVTR